MEVKKVLISLVCLMMLSAFTVMGQVAVKTNLAMDALAIPNVGLEVGISKKLSLDVPVDYNPWKQVMWKEQDNKLFKLFMVQPEIRYWLCDKFNGHFFGVHAMGGAYNTTPSGFNPYPSDWCNINCHCLVQIGNCIIDVGTLPVKQFHERVKDSKFFRFPNSSGILPERLLNCKFNHLNLDRLPISLGIGPVRLH